MLARDISKVAWALDICGAANEWKWLEGSVGASRVSACGCDKRDSRQQRVSVLRQKGLSASPSLSLSLSLSPRRVGVGGVKSSEYLPLGGS